MTGRFRDRSEAGRELAARLAAYAHRRDLLVLALPRGGVPVAFEVAKALQVPLDVFLVRKLGVPGSEELAMGAIATGGVRILNPEIIRSFDVPDSVIQRVSWARGAGTGAARTGLPRRPPASGCGRPRRYRRG